MIFRTFFLLTQIKVFELLVIFSYVNLRNHQNSYTILFAITFTYIKIKKINCLKIDSFFMLI